MEELGQGGRSRPATADSASTRCRARPSGTCSSPSTPMRERMRSSASSTEITTVLYPLPLAAKGHSSSSAGRVEERPVLARNRGSQQVGEELRQRGWRRSGWYLARKRCRLRTNRAKKPAVIRTSRIPRGKRMSLSMDGKTMRMRSTKMAIQPMKRITVKTLWRVGGRPVSRLSRYEKGMSQPTMKMAQAICPHGGLKKRFKKKRVSIGTLPYQMTRYWEKKKYIQNTDMAKVSLAMSWIPEGETWVIPRALARMVRKVTRPKPGYIEVTT